MDYVVTLDPPAVATGRTPLKLNEGPIRVDHAGIDWGDGAITAYMADQRWGSAPVDYRIPNRVVTIPLGLGMDDSSFIAARRQLTEKVALLQREGGWLQRGDTGWYADVVNATLTLPDKYGEGGGVEVDVKLVLECLPDFYGDEVALDAVTGTGQIHTVLEQSGAQAVIAGDHPARCRIIVTDTSGNDQHGLLWAPRSRHYDPATTATLFYEAEALTPQDAAATAAHAGASGGSVVKHASLSTNWTPVLLTNLLAGDALTHLGSYRVFARCYSASATPQLRLVWGSGDLAHYVTNTAAQLPGAGGFFIVDLGTIRNEPQPVGTSSWEGLIQGQAAVDGDPVEIDCLYLMPLDESSGRLLAGTQPPLLNIATAAAGTGANDASTGTPAWTSPSNITTPGFVLAFAFFSVSGVHPVTDARVRLVRAGVIEATDRADTSTPWPQVVDPGVSKTYGSDSDLWGAAWSPTDINASGFGVALSADAGGTISQYLVASDFGFAIPGGATIHGIAATVNRGFNIIGGAGFTRTCVFYISMTVYYSLAGGAIISQDSVVYADQIAELRTEGMLRTTNGSVYGPVGQVLGDLPRLPPSGLEGRPVELFVKCSRGNLSTTADSGLDAFTVQARYRPCYLFGPT